MTNPSRHEPVAHDAIRQLGYVCREAGFETAIDVWRQAFGAGPFWEFDACPLEQTYRGVPTDGGVHAAMTFVGPLMVELLYPTDDALTAWSDWSEPPGGVPPAGLLHHVLVEAPDYDATLARLRETGCAEGWAARLSDGRRVSYVDGRVVFGTFVEVIEPASATTMAWERMRSACAAWDGITRPRRAYAELFDAA